MPQYTHLHNHTSASTFDGAQKPTDFARRIDELNMNAAAITDHGVCYGWPEFQESCDEIGVQPILGVEAYLVEDVEYARELRETPEAACSEIEKHIRSNRFHQVLLAKTQDGLTNLMKLMSWANDEGDLWSFPGYTPTIDFQKLEEYSEGLIATSSCVQGIIPQAAIGRGQFSPLSKRERIKKVMEVTELYLDIFGEDFYLEAHDHGVEDEETMRDVVDWLSGKYDIDVITANDCHYSYEEDYWTQKVRTSIATSNPGDPTFFDSEKAEKYPHRNLHVKGAQEMVDLMPRFPEAATNTMKIADQCNARLPMEDGEYFFPQYPDLSPTETAHERLKKECAKGFRQKYPGATEAHRERMRHELGVIDDMGFNNYFLIVSDMVRYAKAQGITVGAGRGSAAGSMVTYCLDITGLDPMKHDLLFSRFLNPARVTMPDIDIDFDDERREEVLDYLRRKYGEDSVAQVITYSKFKTASAIKKAGKSFRLETSEVEDITDRIPDDPSVRGLTVDEMMESDEVHGLRELERKDERIEEAFEAARRLYGMQSHESKHPAAAVVTPGKVTDYVPTEADTDSDDKKVTLSQVDGDYLEELGLLKIDVLGLKTLRTIRIANDVVEERTGSPVPEETLSTPDDPKVYEEVFAPGNTLGIFQFNGQGMQQKLKVVEPENFTHITAMNALYRPGPIEFIEDFAARMHGEEKTVYIAESIHDAIKDEVGDILDETYGIMVFQEQVMQICQRLAGFSLGEADIMRRAIGKKSEKLLMKQKQKFVEGCIEQGYDRALGETIFDEIEDFASYAFNRSHSACYAAVAYRQAYFKTYHPVAFFTAALRTEDDDGDKVDLMQDAKKNYDIDILPPSVNESGKQFTPIPGKRQIRFGLSTIKNVGKEAQVIIDEREENGSYESFKDLCMRAIPNLGAVRSLIKAGAMDGFDLTRKAMYACMDDLLTHARKMRDYRRGDRVSEPEPPEIENQPEWSAQMRYEQERDVTGGMYTTGEPTDRFPLLTDAFHGETFRRNESYGTKDYMVRCGSILGFKKGHFTGKNDEERPIWFAEYLTPTGLKESPMFEDQFRNLKRYLENEKDTPLVFVGRAKITGKYAGQPVLRNIMPMRRLPSRWLQILRIDAESKEDAREALRYFGGLPEGDTQIWVSVPAGTTRRMDKSVQLDLESYEEARFFGEVSVY